jgi:hypothetical protein
MYAIISLESELISSTTMSERAVAKAGVATTTTHKVKQRANVILERTT